MAYAEVAIAARPHFGQAYSYAIPAGMQIDPGHVVVVPFGPRLLPGVVLSVSDQSAYEGDVRAIAERVGAEPLLADHAVALVRWLAERYLSSPAAALALLLPRGAREPKDYLPPPAAAAPGLRLALSHEETLRTLAGLPGAVAGRGLRLIAALLDRGGSGSRAALRAEQGLTPGLEKTLVEAGLVEAYVTPADRGPLSTKRVGAAGGPRLTPAQQQAADAIAGAMRARFAGLSAPGSFVLHGVTGSGKTEVYLAALDVARAHGRQGMVLVPEIALTPQTERRFAERFPGRVAVMHGQVPPSRRRAQWFGARGGAFDVVVGARSAIFTPLPNLGLIVVDEEHEAAYKESDREPRYHAREVAGELARLTGAVLVLGSATPDLATYRRAEAGVHQILRLPRRVAVDQSGAPVESTPPVLEVVDMARELRQGHSHVLSRVLDAAIAAALGAGRQSLLFLNQRGTASLLLCRECGYAPRCPRCSVAYALHHLEEQLVCHQCNRRRGIPVRCRQCQSTRLRPVGIGTQRLEQLVQERFPTARVLRWDSDTARTQKQHGRFAAAVAGRDADIVVGTQMVARGHDFGGIAVVGVVSADLSLNVPDFRAAERTFQLLLQVAGRSGRRERTGHVYIQTYAPDHYAVRAAALQDYAAFYAKEAAFRKELGYPPFGRLTRLVLSHSREGAAERQAKTYAEKLSAERERLGLPGPEVVGPAPCYFSRVNGRYRWQVLLRGAAVSELLAAVPLPRGWTVDVDPVDVL